MLPERAMLKVLADLEGEVVLGDLGFLEHDVGVFFLPERTYILTMLTNKLASNAAGVQVITEVSRTVYEALKREC